MTTPRFGFIEWLAGTTQPEVLHNTLALKVDVFLAGGVKSRTTSVEPVSPAPTEGDCYILPNSSPAPSGASWSSFSPNQIAVYYDGAWTAYTPPGRFMTYVDDESLVVVWNGSSYTVVTQAVTNNFTATVAPAPTDDAAAGYAVGSLWVDTVADKAYICLNATSTSPASAVWREIGSEIQHNYAASAAPTASDNFNSGYGVGSTWWDTTNDALYFCIDSGSGLSPEAAVWLQLGTGSSDTFEFSSDVETVADQEYVLWWDAPFAGTVTTVRTKTQSGTCTVTGYITDVTASPQEVALGGTANSASTTAQEQAHASANAFSKGDKVAFKVTSNSSATDLAVTFYGTRS